VCLFVNLSISVCAVDFVYIVYLNGIVCVLCVCILHFWDCVCVCVCVCLFIVYNLGAWYVSLLYMCVFCMSFLCVTFFVYECDVCVCVCVCCV